MSDFYFQNKEFEASYNPQLSIISIKGRATPTNPFVDYKAFYDWIIDFIKNPPCPTTINIEIEDFSSTFTKLLVRILLEIEKSFHKNQFNIVWIAKNAELAELANDLLSLTTIPSKIIEK